MKCKMLLASGTRVLSPPVLSGTAITMGGTTVDISGLPTAVHHMPSVIAKPKLYVPQLNSVAANGATISRGELNGLYRLQLGQHCAELNSFFSNNLLLHFLPVVCPRT